MTDPIKSTASVTIISQQKAHGKAEALPAEPSRLLSLRSLKRHKEKFGQKKKKKKRKGAESDAV